MTADDKTDVARQVADHVVGAIDAAAVRQTPFCYLTFSEIFPARIYAEMLRAMPVADDYRALPGRAGVNLKADGSSTRVKLDLFPEYIRRLPEAKRPIWNVVGRVLTSEAVQRAFMQRLAPGLERRFGADHENVGMYPIPVLMRDVAGYRIAPHTDTRWKSITVQIYLPEDERYVHIGTNMNARAPDGTFTVAEKMRFAPNCGYAFAVNDISWHSADAVGEEVRSRDSILLTYFVDSGALAFLRNRGKRVGNYILSEARHLGR